MTPQEVADLRRITVRTLKAHVKNGKVRVRPCMLSPFIRWNRADVSDDTRKASSDTGQWMTDKRGRRRRIA